MNDADSRMKVDVMTMPSEDGVQLGLERFDDPPNPKELEKLISSKPLDLVPVNPDDITKKYASRKGSFADLSIGEILSLGVLGQYFHSKDKDLYDLVLNVEDSWNSQRESVISDGALKKNGKDSQMIVQQVMAQDIAGKEKDGGRIEELVVKRIEEKNERMARGEYPDKSALLISVYSNQQRFDIQKVLHEADLTKYAAYYLVQYKLPEIDLCHVVTMGGYGVPSQFHGDIGVFVLERYENPYGRPNENKFAD